MLSSGTPNYGVLLGNADNKDKYALFSKVGILVNPFQTRRSWRLKPSASDLRQWASLVLCTRLLLLLGGVGDA